MQHRWFLLSVLLVLFSCQGQKTQRSLTLMTYNVGAFSKYEDNTTSGVAQLILNNGASLVALNELDSCNGRHSAYQVKDLAQALGPDWAYHFARAVYIDYGSYAYERAHCRAEAAYSAAALEEFKIVRKEIYGKAVYFFFCIERRKVNRVCMVIMEVCICFHNVENCIRRWLYCIRLSVAA